MASWLGYRGNYQNFLGLNPYQGHTRGNRRGLAPYNPGLSYGTRALGRNALTLAPQRLALGAPTLGGLYGNSLGPAGLNGLAYGGLAAGALQLGGLVADGCGIDCVTDSITGEHYCSACAGYGAAQDQLLALEGTVCVCPNCCQIEINGIDPYVLGGNLIPASLGGVGLVGSGSLVRGCSGFVGDPYGRAGLFSGGGLGTRGLVGRRVGLARSALGFGGL